MNALRLRLPSRIHLLRKHAAAFLCLIPFFPHRWELHQRMSDRLAAVLFGDSAATGKWQEVCRRCGKTRPVANQTNKKGPTP